MNNIKILKTQSLLQEVLQEAFFALNDNRLNNLSVVRVECSKGKEFARVFLDNTGLIESEQKEILKLLKKANGIIRQYLQSSLSWYKIPNLSYEFDVEVEELTKLDLIFKKIHKEVSNNE
ncbi:ribosome-binding factor A [Helicobacter sp. 16-1353]|uniref:30S ribosome-binding factor RbfA n=1 Tax=Helicobacter sp. 16-1353 TaxID=2004996 RepID=UPI000DCAE35D|nr:30S ribosome-binding factor RbfA [Helicobacter sp. 16-1353]RAX55130.1 ribosome-binding factor A [Helicobacter sp. 16-1353]